MSKAEYANTRGCKSLKVLLIETATDGHHSEYLCALKQAVLDAGGQCVIVLPHPCKELAADYILLFRVAPLPYLRWMRGLQKIVRAENPDVIHFAYLDSVYRFFGIGFRALRRQAPVLVTAHQIRRSRMRDMSLKRISRSVDAIVFHTQKLVADVQVIGIQNAVHIEYPQFNNFAICSRDAAWQALGIPAPDRPVILALGGTRYDKGLDLLLQALQKVEAPFHLLIAGKEEYFKKTDIESWIEPYKEHVTLRLEYLTETVMAACLNGADMLVLPYRRIFDGASGPLTEGVWAKKCMIGPAHGSLGAMIREHHLGYTFETENIQDLAEVLQKALLSEFCPNEGYLAYRALLDPARFQKDYSNLYKKFANEA